MTDDHGSHHVDRVKLQRLSNTVEDDTEPKTARCEWRHRIAPTRPTYSIYTRAFVQGKAPETKTGDRQSNHGTICNTGCKSLGHHRGTNRKDHHQEVEWNGVGILGDDIMSTRCRNDQVHAVPSSSPSSMWHLFFITVTRNKHVKCFWHTLHIRAATLTAGDKAERDWEAYWREVTVRGQNSPSGPRRCGRY